MEDTPKTQYLAAAIGESDGILAADLIASGVEAWQIFAERYYCDVRERLSVGQRNLPDVCEFRDRVIASDV